MLIELEHPELGRLGEVLPDFEVCSRRALECILRLPTFCSKDFRLLPQLEFPLFRTCILQSSNDEYTTTLLLAVNKSNYHELLPTKREEEVTDALGEVANVIAGNFLGRTAFTKRFGPMVISPPHFSESENSVLEDWTIQGVLLVKNVKIFLGFMMHAVGKEN